MKYKIVRENKPTLKNYGRYKAVAMHFQTIDAEQVAQEVQDNCSAKRSDVELVLGELLEVLARHLKQGDRVRTIGGIYGTISSIKDDVIILSVGPDKVKLVFARGAISQVEDAGVENTMSEEIKD